MVCRNVFQVVCLVENDNVVLGQQAFFTPPVRKVREEQGVIDDEDLRVLNPASGLTMTLPSNIAALCAAYVIDDGPI